MTHSLGILLAGLFEAERRDLPSEPCLIVPEVPSEPPGDPDPIRRTESGVHRIR